MYYWEKNLFIFSGGIFVIKHKFGDLFANFIFGGKMIFLVKEYVQELIFFNFWSYVNSWKVLGQIAII